MPDENESGGATKRELHFLEKLNIVGQLSLVGVGIVAACIYGCQLHTMNGQLSQMQSSSGQTDQLLCLYRKQLEQITKQSQLMSDQLRGTSAAYLNVYVGIGFGIGNFDTAFNVIKVGVRNSGHAIARDVTVHITVEQFSLDGHRIGPPVHYNIFQPALDFNSGSSEIAERYVFRSSADAAIILAAAKNLQQTMQVSWDYSYGNGFGETIKGVHTCRTFLRDDWIPCENLPAMLADLRAQKH